MFRLSKDNLQADIWNILVSIQMYYLLPSMFQPEDDLQTVETRKWLTYYYYFYKVLFYGC